MRSGELGRDSRDQDGAGEGAGDWAQTALLMRRVVPGTPERVFAAWTDPERLGRWLSPTGQAQVDLDLRVGGAFRVVMLGPDRQIEHTGEYREIDPPRRLVFTWRSPYTGDTPSLVTVELRAVAADSHKTELTLIHEQLPPHQVESHRGGWGRIIDNLSGHLRMMEGR